MATAAALASVFLVLLAAPLILGSGSLLRHADRRLRLLWLTTLTGLLALALAAGAVSLALLLF